MSASPHTALGPGREFDEVRSLLARWGSRAVGVGDDAAVLTLPPGSKLVLSTDTSVEDVHFRRGWLTAEEIGWRATMAALSDLAAMGAEPSGILLALTVPQAWRAEMGAIADGVGEAAAAANVAIVGGDLSAGAALTLAVTVAGHAEHPVFRSGARPCDALYVTGALGGPGAALAAYLRGEVPERAARERFARPVARLREGAWLAQRGVTAMIDISDGLVAELGHLASASRAHVVVDLEKVPLLLAGVSGDAGAAARSGEEYELLFTAPPDLDVDAFRSEFPLALSRIGEVGHYASGEGARVRLMRNGAVVDLAPGYDHFSL